MRSSISNSDPAKGSTLTAKMNLQIRQATVAVILSLVMVLLGAEALSRYAFPRVSQIEERIHNDETQAMSIRASAPGSLPTVLLVGNSLLLRGLDYPKLRSEMAPSEQVVRFVIESTDYLDWYYGLHHMFTSGVRPSVVVVCLNLGQTVSSRTLGDYSARHLFGVPELLPVAHDARMDATQTSGLFLAHWSAFYASRATIRNYILNRTAPAYGAALHALADSGTTLLADDDELVGKARTRLHSIDQLCRHYGAEFVLLIPPSLGRYNDLLASAAQLQVVNFHYPLPTGALGPEYFRADRDHLNDKGAVVFTDAIAVYLRARSAKHAKESPPAVAAGDARPLP
jgi:hypothetical protein